MPRLHSRAVIDTPETSKLPAIPEVVWQQHQDTQLIHIHNKFTKNNKRKNDVGAQTSPIKETSSQVSGSDTELLLENQTRSTPVQCLSDSEKQQHEVQRNETDMTAHDSGDDKIPLPKITTSQFEERIVRDDITNELYMPLTYTTVLKKERNNVCPSGFREWLNSSCPC